MVGDVLWRSASGAAGMVRIAALEALLKTQRSMVTKDVSTLFVPMCMWFTPPTNHSPESCQRQTCSE